MLDNQEKDWLLQTVNSPINLFDKIHVFDEMVERFKRHGYQVHEFDCREFKAQEDILNAILYSVGELSPERFYKNIMLIQFWDMFRSPCNDDNGKAVMVFRYFDTFHRLDPVCGQELMQILANSHYRELLRGHRLIICAHCEGPGFRLKPVLLKEATFNGFPDFSEAADIQKTKRENAYAWWATVMEMLQAEGVKTISSARAATTIGAQLGLKSSITIHNDIFEANLPFEDILRLVKKQEKAEAWWEEVTAALIAEIDDLRLWLRIPSDMILRQLGLGTLVELYDAPPTMDELRCLAQNLVVEISQRRSQNPGNLSTEWYEKVTALYNISSEIRATRETIGRALEYIGTQEGQVEPSIENSTPEAAVELLLKIAPEQMKTFMRMKSKIIKREDRGKEPDEQA